jgi:hypothetical protein
MKTVKLIDSENKRTLHIGSIIIDLNESDYINLLDIFKSIILADLNTINQTCSLNWRVRSCKDDFFFIEADLPNAALNGHYPRLELMQEDYGDHNGYTKEMRMSDAQLIVLFKKMLSEAPKG